MGLECHGFNCLGRESWLTELYNRLALSYNQISTLPARFAECTSLRYLNIRNNAIREFPLSVRINEQQSACISKLIFSRFASSLLSKSWISAGTSFAHSHQSSRNLRH